MPAAAAASSTIGELNPPGTDAMVTGATRKNALVYKDVRRVIEPLPGVSVHGVTAVIARGRTVLVADTMIEADPSPAMLAHIAESAAKVARRLGLDEGVFAEIV